MKKIGIIIRREFLYRVKKRSFVLLTVLMPFLFAAVVIVPVALSSLKSDEQQKVVIIDRTGIYAPLFHDNESFSFVNSDKMQKSYRDEQSDVYAVLSIWDDLSKNETASRIYSRKEVSVELEQMVNSVLEKKIYEQRVASYGIPNLDKVMKECEVDFKVRTVRWSDNGDEKESSTAAAMFVGIFFTLLIYIFVLQYGGMVMQSVTEEKSNRIMELMVSSVKPFTLMLGKIVGVALVGLLQMFIWGVMLFIIMTVLGVWLGVPEVTSGMVGNTAMAAVPETGDAAQILSVIKGMNLMEIGVMFVLCFVFCRCRFRCQFKRRHRAVYGSHSSDNGFRSICRNVRNKQSRRTTCLLVFHDSAYFSHSNDGAHSFWWSYFRCSCCMLRHSR